MKLYTLSILTNYRRRTSSVDPCAHVLIVVQNRLSSNDIWIFVLAKIGDNEFATSAMAPVLCFHSLLLGGSLFRKNGVADNLGHKKKQKLRHHFLAHFLLENTAKKKDSNQSYY